MKIIQKQEVVEAYQKMLQSKIEDINKAIDEIIESRNNESKSTAGDKYETARAMAQIELQQSEIQRNELIKQLLQLNTIDTVKIKNTVSFGSLVITDSVSILFGVAVGELKLKTQTFYCLSLASPIGQMFVGKDEGAILNFKSKAYQILKIS